MTDIILTYDHSPGIEVQQTYFWCGPTSTEIVLNGRGVILSQQDLADEIGTTVDGTASVGLIVPVLNHHLPGANYVAVYSIDREVLWANIISSINEGYGCVFNIDVPPSNYPVGVLGSQSPAYGGGEVFHYIAGMGYNDDDPNLRAVWIADPGFRPFGYWVALDQLATMIPPKGYTYATAHAQPDDSVEAVMTTNQDKLDAIYNKLLAYPDSPNIAGRWPSRSRYAPDGQGGVDDTVGMILNTDATVYDILIETASVAGDPDSRAVIAARAKAHPDDKRAVFFATKYPSS